jgi:hypothetical protein
MVTRTFPTIADAWFVDCGLQYLRPPVDTVSGLDHLEGRTVAILGDGSVVPSAVVTGGAVTLDATYSKVTIGLPYTCDLVDAEPRAAEPDRPDHPGQAEEDRQVTVRVKDARGLQVGIEQEAIRGAMTAGTPRLTEIKQRTTETLGTAMAAFTGDYSVVIPSEWNVGGRIFVRQSYPLPASVLDLIPDVNIGS